MDSPGFDAPGAYGSLDWLLTPGGRRRRWLRRLAVRRGALAAAVVAVVAAVVLAVTLAHRPVADVPRGAPPQIDAPFARAALRPLTPEQALRFNAGIATDRAPNPVARMFTGIAADPLSQARAETCLTAAVYYEAGSESLDGQRAVAQVVLNRVRHPAYPHSVCGVVWQGSERPQGCQFTFTCDGSLARRPDAAGWARAAAVARAALAGYVFAPVGWATHYHADYVVPYWAASLDKVAVIGAHIFYRWGGGWGRPGAFASAYAGREPLVVPYIGHATLPATAAGGSAGAAAQTAAPVAGYERPVLVNAAPGRSGASVDDPWGAPAPEPTARPAATPQARWIIGDAPPAASAQPKP